MQKYFKVFVLLLLFLVFTNYEPAYANHKARTLSPSPASGTVTVGGNISGIAIDPTSGSLLITDYTSNKAIFYAGMGGDPILSMGKNIPDSMTMDTTFIHNPLNVVFDSSSHSFFVANSNIPAPDSMSSSVTAITIIRDNGTPFFTSSLTSEVLMLSANATLSGIALNTDDHLAFISLFNNNSIVIQNTANFNEQEIIRDIGKGPVGVAYDVDNDIIYVANSIDMTISVLGKVIGEGNAYRKINTISLNFTPIGIVIDPDSGSLYLTKQGTNTFEILEPNDNNSFDFVNPSFSVNAIAIDTTGHRVFIVNSDQGTLTVIDTTTNTVKNTYSVDNAQSITYSPSKNKLFIGTSDGKLVTINATRL